MQNTAVGWLFGILCLISALVKEHPLSTSQPVCTYNLLLGKKKRLFLPSYQNCVVYRGCNGWDGEKEYCSIVVSNNQNMGFGIILLFK